MEISHNEALAVLRKLKGSSLYLRLRLTADDDTSLGALRITAEATLEECDENSVLLTWPHNAQMRLMLEGASFRVADYDESAVVGLEIKLREGIKCVICPSEPVNRVVNKFLNGSSGKSRIAHTN
jgi:hypothetical protein